MGLLMSILVKLVVYNIVVRYGVMTVYFLAYLWQIWKTHKVYQFVPKWNNFAHCPMVRRTGLRAEDMASQYSTARLRSKLRRHVRKKVRAIDAPQNRFRGT